MGPVVHAESTPPYGENLAFGLGLAIVRSLVKMHGGRIRVASEGKGHGATFTLELPVLEAASAIGNASVSERAVLPPGSATLPALTDITVLVVDDQQFARDVVAAILRRTSFGR